VAAQAESRVQGSGLTPELRSPFRARDACCPSRTLESGKGKAPRPSQGLAPASRDRPEGGGPRIHDRSPREAVDAEDGRSGPASSTLPEARPVPATPRAVDRCPGRSGQDDSRGELAACAEAPSGLDSARRGRRGLSPASFTMSRWRWTGRSEPKRSLPTSTPEFLASPEGFARLFFREVSTQPRQTAVVVLLSTIKIMLQHDKPTEHTTYRACAMRRVRPSMLSPRSPVNSPFVVKARSPRRRTRTSLCRRLAAP
jgi:hypothetical protein